MSDLGNSIKKLTAMIEEYSFLEARLRLYDMFLNNLDREDIVSYKLNSKGDLHCSNGPALVVNRTYASGHSFDKFWVVNGRLCHSLEEFLKYSRASDKTKMLLKLKHTNDDFGKKL